MSKRSTSKEGFLSKSQESSFIISNKRKGGPNGRDDENKENQSPNAPCRKCSHHKNNGRKKQKMELQKETAHDFIKVIFGTEFSNKMLTHIIFSEDGNNVFTVVGRPSVEGSSTKQMRHVTPCAYLLKVIENRVKESQNPKDFLNSIANFVLMLIPEKKGLAVSSQDLKSFNTPLRKSIREQSSKSLILNNKENINNNSPEKMLLVSPGAKVSKVLATTNGGSLDKALDQYPASFKEFCRIGIEKLISEATSCGDNTSTMLAEAFARIIFILFNQRKNAAYPNEGNTAKYDIRYYNNEAKAKAKTKDYIILTAKELKAKYDEETNIDNLVRTVDAEGHNVKITKLALDTLGKILNDLGYEDLQLSVDNELLEKYNKEYNSTIKLTNEILDPFNSKIASYNTSLTDEVSKSDIYCQIAKHLFNLFDYKALEEVVFIEDADGKIKAYNDNTSKKTKSFDFMKGDDYRKQEVRFAKGYNHKVVYRNKEYSELSKSEEKQIENLAEKIVEHGIICLLSYTTLNTNETLTGSLNKFSTLLGYEHGVDDTKLCKAVSDKFEQYSKALSGENLSGLNIAFSQNEESLKFSTILGNEKPSCGQESSEMEFVLPSTTIGDESLLEGSFLF